MVIRFRLCVARALLAGFTILALPVLSSGTRAEAEDGDFVGLAKELQEQIERSRLSLVDLASAYVYGERPRIAVWPFKEDEIPISKEIADDFNGELLAELVRQMGGTYEFVAREALKALIQDMAETGALEDAAGDPISAVLKSAQNIDVLIVGQMRLLGDAVKLSYKAVSVDGRILAATRPRNIALRREEADITAARLTLDQAIRVAVRYLSDRASAMEELRLGGIRFQSSGVQPPFGRYLEGRVSGALQDAFTNIITNSKLVVRRAELGVGQFTTMRGLEVKGKDLKRENFELDPGIYVLSGSYWDFGRSVEIRLSLKNARGETISWSDRVRRDSLPGNVALRPPGDFGQMTENDGLGPIAFHLTTPRGKDPAYRIGEKLNLLIRTDRDAWVYCFYLQADGNMIQIFPNPHYWTVFEEPLLQGNRLHTIPGETTFPFDLVLGEPAGMELIKCFATTRDVTNDLPQELQGRSLDPRPKSIEARLSKIFRDLRDAGTTEASLVITLDR